jgi:hypothetical protein
VKEREREKLTVMSFGIDTHLLFFLSLEVVFTFRGQPRLIFNAEKLQPFAAFNILAYQKNELLYWDL